MTSSVLNTASPTHRPSIATIEEIEQRVLWLAVRIGAIFGQRVVAVWAS